MGKLDNALNNVNMTYEELVAISNDIVSKCTKTITPIIRGAIDNVNNLSNDDLRNLITTLSLQSFCFSELKEKSALKSTCAELLRKSKYANAYLQAEGTVTHRDNIATVNSEEELLTEAIFDMVANSLRTYLDETHRVVDSLKTVLLSRLSEAKLISNDALEEQ